MRSPHRTPPLLCMLSLCAASLCACSQHVAPAAASARTTAQGAPIAAESGASTADTASNGDPQQVPLSAADIQLYLTVMRAAAARVRHPSAQDLADLRQAEAFRARASQQTQADAPAIDAYAAAAKQMQAAASSGDAVAFSAASATARAAMTGVDAHGTYDPVAAQRALMLDSGQTDRLIVAERHIDTDRYNRISDAIEEIAVPPQLDAGASCGGHCDNDAPAPSATQAHQRRRHDNGLIRNRKALAPYRQEIRTLQSVVRSRRQAGNNP